MRREKRLKEIEERLERIHPCPRYATTDGKEICSSCHDDLAWLAFDHMEWLLAQVHKLTEKRPA